MDKEQNILETQLVLGKKVLEIVLDLLEDKTNTAAILPFKINDYGFTLTLEKEVKD